MMNIGELFSEKFIHASGWTLVHSLWQGALVALFFGLILLFMRKASSRTRYLAGMSALVLIVVLSVFTFVQLYNNVDEGATKAAAVTSVSMTPVGDSAGEPVKMTAGKAAVAGGVSWFERVGVFFQDYVTPHLPLMVAIWLLGILVSTLRFIGGVAYNHRLRVYRNKEVSADWNERLNRLCARAGINKTVGLLESSMIKAPVVIGYIKPVVLLPVGMASGIPVQQLEALLAHELAHISRNDYLLNIVQQWVDAFYFFHPGVRWVSSFVRMERENCCDDFAVELSGDSVNFARALSSAIDYSHVQKAPALAMALAGRGKQVLKRVKRVLRPQPTAPKFSEGALTAGILMLFLVFGAAGVEASLGLGHHAPLPLAAMSSAIGYSADNNLSFSTAPGIKQETALEGLTVEADSEILIGGEFQSSDGTGVFCKIINSGTGAAAWSLNKGNRANGEFKERVLLKKGKYKVDYSDTFTVLYIKPVNQSYDDNIVVHHKLKETRFEVKIPVDSSMKAGKDPEPKKSQGKKESDIDRRIRLTLRGGKISGMQIDINSVPGEKRHAFCQIVENILKKYRPAGTGKAREMRRKGGRAFLVVNVENVPGNKLDEIKQMVYKELVKY